MLKAEEKIKQENGMCTVCTTVGRNVYCMHYSRAGCVLYAPQ